MREPMFRPLVGSERGDADESGRRRHKRSRSFCRFFPAGCPKKSFGKNSDSPVDFLVTGGEVHDCKEAPDLIAKLPLADYIVADKGYDSEPFRIQIREKGSMPLIPRKHNSTVGNDDMDWSL